MGSSLAGSASTFRRRDGFASRDPDETRSIVTRALSRHKVSWSGGPVDAALHSATVGRLSIILLRYGAPARIEPEERNGFYIVQVPVRGRARAETGKASFDVDPETGLVLSPDTRVLLDWSRGCEQLLVKIPQAALEGVWRALTQRPLRAPPRFQHQLGLESIAGRAFRQFIDCALSDGVFDHGVPAGRAFLHQVEETFLASLLMAHPGTHSEELARAEPRLAPKYIRFAEAHMRAHLKAPASLADLSRAVGVSARTLNQLFRDFRETSPMAAWRRMRLEAARADLLAAPPGVRVVDVALRWGFSHLGRFSAYYRQRFGELPRQTLTR
jgi:AraC-like DNA-binding protein